MRDQDWGKVRRTCQQILNQSLPHINQIASLSSVYPDSPDLHQQMAVIHLPASTDLPVLKRRLYDEYRIEIPLIDWNGNKLARISFQGYNTPGDLDALAQALKDLLPTASLITHADSGF